MILRDLLSCWPFGSKTNQGLDLTAEIDACERQLRTKNKNDLPNEGTPLFRGLASGDSTTQRRMTGSSRDDFGAAYRSEEAPSRLEYSYKPLRLLVQLFSDTSLGLAIATVWILDCLYRWLEYLLGAIPTAIVWISGRCFNCLAIAAMWLSNWWYRTLYPTLPPAICFTTYKFITRGENAPPGVSLSYLIALLVLMGLTLAVTATSMSRSSRSSLLSNR